jgi:hypothetical protein
MLNIGQTHPKLGLLNGPGERLAQRLAGDGTTGLADGHQACLSPVEGAVVLQLAHQSAVHEHDEIHVPGLAQSVTHLAIAHAQMLLPVPMIGLCPGPAPSIQLEDMMRFPIYTVGDQHLARLAGLGTRPQHQDAHQVIDLRDVHGLGKVPLGVPTNCELCAE